MFLCGNDYFRSGRKWFWNLQNYHEMQEIFATKRDLFSENYAEFMSYYHLCFYPGKKQISIAAVCVYTELKAGLNWITFLKKWGSL